MAKDIVVVYKYGTFYILSAKIVTVEAPEPEAPHSIEEVPESEDYSKEETGSSGWNNWDGVDNKDQSDNETSPASSPARPKTTDQLQTESDIDQEIEDELEAMESPRGQSKSPVETVDPGPPVTVDWSDVSPAASASSPSNASTATRKGVLKLKGPKLKTRTSPPPSDSHSATPQSPEGDSNTRQVARTSLGDSWDSGGWDNAGDNWGEAVTPTKSHSHSRYSSDSSRGAGSKRSSVTSIDSKSSSNTTRSKNSPTRKPPRVVDFDIDSLDIKTSKTGGGTSVKIRDPELDLFADMAPVITPQSNLLSLLGGVSGDPPPISNMATAFAVQDTSDNVSMLHHPNTM